MTMRKPTVTTQLIGSLRRILGVACLILGILGCLLPILPGWPFLIPAILLLGRRDPWLRRCHLLLRRTLRRLRRARHPLLGGLGRRLSSEYVRSKRTLAPRIVAIERALKLEA